MAIHRDEPPATVGRQFSKALELADHACGDCGFTDTILAGDWSVRTGRDPHNGHVVYRLECPDCTAVEQVEMNIP